MAKVHLLAQGHVVVPTAVPGVQGRLLLARSGGLGLFGLRLADAQAVGQVLQLQFHVLIDQHLLLGQQLGNLSGGHQLLLLLPFSPRKGQLGR